MDSHIYTGAGTGAQFNPFRYRGYYYDSDLGFYYLNSRYYDANTGRFINVDDHSVITATPDALTDKNLYAYCDNNPVMRADNGGEFWHILVGAAVGAIVNSVAQIVTNVATGEDWNDGLGIAAVSGALSGALTSSGLPVGVVMAGEALISGTESIVSQGIENGFYNIDWVDVTINTVMGGVTSISGCVSVGNGKHLMTAGKNATKSIKTNGLKHSFKYYASQTYNVFYKSAFEGAVPDIFKSSTQDIGNHYIKTGVEYIYERYCQS